ncbi:MAG: hypothetical protein KHX03_09190 [Clostridium sp.]|nr:hypothetical protein [Clostridium sp.]
MTELSKTELFTVAAGDKTKPAQTTEKKETKENFWTVAKASGEFKNTNIDEYQVQPAARDATYVAPKVLPEVENVKKATKEEAEKVLERKPRDGKTAYIDDYKDYKPKDEAKYNKVLKHVSKKASGEKAHGIANMVCSLSEKYGIDPEITVAILEKETGGYNFKDSVMVNPGKQYKGVMQVDKTTIECMYADGDAWKKMKSGTRKAILSYDHRHFKADDERIAELKKKYPTEDALYQAIQKDVSLGVEVGIMAYKGKLSRAKGDTRKALAQYCGSQYKLPPDSTAVRKIWPLPEYKEV